MVACRVSGPKTPSGTSCGVLGWWRAMRRYRHLFPDETGRAAAVFDAHVRGSSTEQSDAAGGK